MNCPYCGSNIGVRNRCNHCGEDVTLFQRAYRIANQYYNEGLRKARLRDLSGAILSLKNCLKLNKEHTDARNLLGLVYYETGESVSAIREWIISQHFQEEDNRATYYIGLVQKNPSKLEEVGQIIKRYNGALTAARQGSNDVAIIQLKKAISLNPHYVQALQLLGLIYIKERDYNKARKCLVRASKIDVANATTLAYLEELHMLQPDGGSQKAKENTLDEGRKSRNAIASGNQVILSAQSYTEEKPNIMAWVNLVLGIIIGAAFIMVAIVPGIRKNSVQSESTELVALNERLVKADADLEAAQKEKESLEQDVKKLENQLKKVQKELTEAQEVPEEDKTVYENLMKAVVLFLEEKEEESANMLLSVDKNALELESAAQLYNKLSGQLFAEQSEEIYQSGHTLYTNGHYEQSLVEFDKALQMNPDNVDAMYFTGRAYHRLKEYDTARIWYNKLIEDYPDTGRAKEAAARLRELEKESGT